jgi:hypothetical protein
MMTRHRPLPIRAGRLFFVAKYNGKNKPDCAERVVQPQG